MKRRRDHRGFTQVELVVVIAITGILAAVAMPRFVGRDAFDSRGFHDVAISNVRFAQKTAVAWRRDVYVCVASNSIIVGTAAGCGTNERIVNPVTRQELIAASPAGVTLAGSVVGPGFRFDGAGRPVPNSQITIAFNSTIADDPARQIVVEAETGYVHP